MTRKMVYIFRPRVDRLTNSIGKQQTVRTPQELYLTLTFPDLPDADSLSDELVEFMELNFPRQQINDKIDISKNVIEEMISLGDPEITTMIVGTLQRDITAIEQLIPILEMQQDCFTREKLPPP